MLELSTMRVADFIDPGQIAARSDATRPVPAAGEVIVAVEACGICGSDLHMFRNGSYRDQLVRATPEGYHVPGHEFAGTIDAIGEGVVGWSVGERVVGVTGLGGGMADYVAVPVNPFQLVRMPEGVDMIEAATTEQLADGLQMVRKAAIKPGEHVVIFGVGIIGLSVIQAIRARGIEAGQVIAVDVHQARLEAALAQGATAVVNARDGDVFDQVAAITGMEEGYQGKSARIGAVIDCAGYIKHMPGPPPLETALRLIDLDGGRIVCFGAYEDRMTIDFGPMIQKQPTIMGSNGYAAEELVEALAYMAERKVDRASLISHRFPISQAPQAFAAQCAPEAIKVMLTMERN
ncbi:zinc-dependent alcohol dehydrogenase [Novosphingobium sp. Chol11]|jgi:(R,R)-butanediol dehydrogenase / meso-butanediol dehydrogenase / diacetyl reductase|uniref:zinc-dependent alcohol dehydrogenase n=1 Tax=Novosphingobium sp. Chol11 TaxID=1385763 RepID=UPI0020D21B4D|nr:zinc-binding dehydrogenase [Novosphingobium sp. Chol11]